MSTPLPGDFACVSIDGAGGVAIDFAQILDGDLLKDASYEHALVFVGDGQVVQAEPHGAVRVPLGTYKRQLWSTGTIALTDAQRAAIVSAAVGYIGTPYSWLDYAAIASHRWSSAAPWLPLAAGGLRDYIATTRHMICSQLVDQCYADAGVHLFTDGRWPGYVTPGDLAQLLTA